ncbi:MAG TPA: ATP-dependent DNA helicase [Acidimicrobiia bacterium]|nr:ATP-dependent DNA helicase [Acidimicrobiia bacterium]
MEQTRLEPAEWPEAVADITGRQVIVAGPGTGKTEFLVRRVGHILTSGAARPRQVVVVSFSRRATAKLRERIEKEVGETGVPVDVATFHSLALRLIEAATGGDRPIPLTTPEQVGLVRQILASENPDNWPVNYRGILTSQAFSDEVADFLLRCSERLLSPDDLATKARVRADWRGLPGLYARYLESLREQSRSDYGVLLSQAVDLLQTDAGRDLISDFAYVLVDEFQDTSPAQAEMAELLARAEGNLTVAGDPYQSIFSFRGAEVRNIATFSERPGTKRYVLAQSFRVPAPIMESALRVISSGDLPGAAGPVTPAGHPGSAESYVFDQETAEAEWIAREIEHMVRTRGVEPSRIAVVVRSKREFIAELSRALDRRSVPHDPPVSRLVDHPAVGVVQDVVTVALHGSVPVHTSVVESLAADRAMRRLVLGPLIGVSVGLERQMTRERNRGKTWLEVVNTYLPDHGGLAGLLSDPAWVRDIGAAEGFWTLWTSLDGISDIVSGSGREEWRRAWTAFGQMLNRQAERDPTVSLSGFFEMVDDDGFEATPLLSHRLTDDRVILTTLHQVKGLEFDVVFIANAVEGVFPDLRRSRRMLRPELLSPERTTDPDAQHLFQVQEEMRLAYTAMTRARSRVIWTATDAGIDQGERRPSRFLLAAAGNSTVGPPRDPERDPLTIWEAEAALRRMVLDVATPAPRRLAAARVLGQADSKWWDPTAFAGAVVPGPDHPVMPEEFRLSPSQADSYRRCPRRYLMERRLRLSDATSIYAHLGEITHEVLETAEAEVIGTGANHAEIARVVEILDKVWEEKANFGSPALNDAWKTKTLAMITHLYENWPGRGEPIAVELPVESEIGGVEWVGRVDRLERSSEGLRVVDYKTTTSVPTIEDSSVSIQLAFYAHAVAEAHGEVVASEMWYPRKPTKSVTTRKLAMHRVGEVTEKMAGIATDIKAEKWEPRVSGDCKNCTFRRSCPAWPEGKGAFLP